MSWAQTARGKTSLLSAITGYLPFSDGSLEVLGRRYGHADWRELRKQIGIVGSALRQMMPDGEPVIRTLISGRHAMVDFWGEATTADQIAARRMLRRVACTHLAERPWGVPRHLFLR